MRVLCQMITTRRELLWGYSSEWLLSMNLRLSPLNRLIATSIFGETFEANKFIYSYYKNGAVFSFRASWVWLTFTLKHFIHTRITGDFWVCSFVVNVISSPFQPDFFVRYRYGVRPEQVAEIAVKNHNHSVNNPYSQFRFATTLAEVLSSTRVAFHLTKLQCWWVLWALRYRKAQRDSIHVRACHKRVLCCDNMSQYLCTSIIVILLAERNNTSTFISIVSYEIVAVDFS